MPIQTPENVVDVLVIGAGPAGLMCSNALASAGDIKLRVIDQRCVHQCCEIRASGSRILRLIDLQRLLLAILMGHNRGPSKFYK